MQRERERGEMKRENGKRKRERNGKTSLYKNVILTVIKD